MIIINHGISSSPCSCNVMQDVNNGVETQVRRKKAEHLLDIDGDTCHHVHNSSKKVKKFVDLDRCALHKVHTAFGKGVKELLVDIPQFLIDVHSLFKLSAGRRAGSRSLPA